MLLTEQIQSKKSPELSQICHLAKNLYNKATFYCRQSYFRLEEFLTYFNLHSLLKNHETYKALPAQTSQQILRIIGQNWKSYRNALKEYSKIPNKFHSRPNIPRYKKKNGESIVVFTNQNTKLKNGKTFFPKKTNLPPLKTRITAYQQIRIIPKGRYYVYEIIYHCEITKFLLDTTRMLSIDLGIENLLTSANNIELRPLIVKGKIVKSINQWYNKIRAINRSYVESFHPETKRMQIQTRKRNNKIRDYFHKTSRMLINYCIVNNIGNIVVGYNKNWKSKSKLGKKNNQKFISIPYYKLIHMIKYKAELVGINFITTEEFYTSKCSALDNEEIGKHKKYLGRRINRGLFQSSKGIKFNADVNGAMNILRKVVSRPFKGEEIAGLVLNPQILTIK